MTGDLSESVRGDFPIFSRKLNGMRLAYLDNAATAQMPRQVIAAVSDYYSWHHANVHRGVHALSVEATELLEASRRKVASFINARPDEIVFVRNATEAVNIVARSWGDANVAKGDALLLTQLEHHSNIVPWQQLAARRRAEVGFARITPDGSLDLDDFSAKIGGLPKLAAFTAVSNALGTILPIRKLVSQAHAAGSMALVDACQLAPHAPIDVKSLDCDFMAFSGHKMLGPTGIGVLYAKRELLDGMPPFLGGGDMIREVTQGGFAAADVPAKFEAGTPNISGAVGLAAAIDYISAIGFRKIHFHEQELFSAALDGLSPLPYVTLYGPVPRAAIVSFNAGDAHAHDVGSILDSRGVCIRSGHHCAQPLMHALGVAATARASFYLYNGIDDVDALVGGVKEVSRVFSLK